MSSDAVCVSCPGKVLLTGGYLVLDPSYNGLVLATPSRFYTVVQPGTLSSEQDFTISVHSPQFLDGHWQYQAAKDAQGQWSVQDVSKDSKNPFVFLAIRETLRLASAVHPSAEYPSLRVTIVGSNDFYSQSRSEASSEDVVPFAPLGVKLRDVHKTGLGSSAAMVTSLVSALFLLWTTPSPSFASSTMVAVSSPPRSKGLELVPQQPDKATLALCHNLAQYVHSLAQGKIGSGFDVSAAIWGSHIYRRFSVECLGSLLDESTQSSSNTDLLKILSPLHNDKWTKSTFAPRVSPLALPPGLTLLLADVDAGSNTPSMVGKVLAWRKRDSQAAEELWQKLKSANDELANSLEGIKRIASSDAKTYSSRTAELVSRRLSKPTADEENDEVSKAFKEVASQIRTIRSMMKQMGQAADVPIEPDEQTALLDQVSELEGVIGAGVPGAGGYDAVWILVVTPDSEEHEEGAIERVVEFVGRYKDMSVRLLSKNAWIRGGGAAGEGAAQQQGLVREHVDTVNGLSAAIMRSTSS